MIHCQTKKKQILHVKSMIAGESSTNQEVFMTNRTNLIWLDIRFRHHRKPYKTTEKKNKYKL
jgi:hypothetical protein